MNPIPQRLAVQAADPGRFATIHPVADRRQRQQPSALVDVLRPPGQRPKLGSRIILSQSHPRRHRQPSMPPSTSFPAIRESPYESASTALWYKLSGFGSTSHVRFFCFLSISFPRAAERI
jgi:hypothetical protein